MPSIFPPTVSIPVGLATAAIVVSVFQKTNPPIADIRVADSQSPALASSERTATWTATGIVAGISLVTKDPDIFIIGGITVIIMAWMHRHANAVAPETNRAATVFRAPELVPETVSQGANYGYIGDAVVA